MQLDYLIHSLGNCAITLPLRASIVTGCKRADITWRRESMREKRAADSRDARFLLAKSIAASCLLAFLHSNASTLHIAVNDDGIHHFAWVMWLFSPPAAGAIISFALTQHIVS